MSSGETEIKTASHGAPKPVLQVRFPVAIQAKAHGQILTAELLDRHGTVRFADVDYSSPSKAGQVATGWKSCNGWTVWTYHDSVTGAWHAIQELKTD